jgi:hypothetical protein
MESRAKVRLHINDPLSLAQPNPEGLVWPLLEDVEKAWSQADQEGALRLCREAMRCAHDFGNLAEVAMAQLYRADAEARSSNLEEADEFARRAVGNFERAGECHNQIMAHLWRARLKQASQQTRDAVEEYKCALTLCEKLESKGSETTGSEQGVLYGHLIEGIRRALGDVKRDITGQYAQRCRLRSIPVLRPSEGPGAVLECSETIKYVNIGEFEIQGNIYFLYPLDVTRRYELELKANACHFALPIPKDRWLDPDSREGDYVLLQKERELTPEGPAISWIGLDSVNKEGEYTVVRRETKLTQEGPVVLWVGDEWVAGRFERDTEDNVHFLPQPPRILGDQKAVPCKAIALFKRAPFA